MFEPTMHLPNPHSPFQPLELRCRRCHYLVRYGRRPSRDRDDCPIFDGWRYLLDRRACRDRSDQEQLAQRHLGDSGRASDDPGCASNPETDPRSRRVTVSGASKTAQAAQRRLDHAYARYLSAIRALGTMHKWLRPTLSPLELAVKFVPEEKPSEAGLRPAVDPTEGVPVMN